MAQSMENPLWKGLSKTKQQILDTIGSDAPLTAKQVFEKVRQKNKAPVSYQAVHKILTSLERELVLEKTSKGYQFNRAWLEKTEQWLKTAKKRLTEKTDLEKPEIKVFQNVIETGRFLIFDFFNYPNPENKTSVCIWKRMYSLMGLSKEEIEGVRDTMGKNHFHVVSESDTAVDRFIAEAFEQMGGKVKVGIPNPEDFDAIIVGDYVCEIYYGADHKKRWKKLWETPKTVSDFDLEQTLETMHHQYTTKAIIYHDPERAAKIREHVEKYFKREK